MKKKLKCWEVFECKEKGCPAYGSKELTCWLIPKTHCRSEIQGRFLEKIEMCLECEPFEANIDFDSMRQTLNAANQQFEEFRRIVEDREKELEGTSMELASGLSEAIEALGEIASGNPEVRIRENGELEPIRNLKQMINMTAENLGEIVNLSHEFAIGLAEHFDALDRVSRGDLRARISGTSPVELLESLKNVTNQMIQSVSEEITERGRAEEEIFRRNILLDAINKVLKETLVCASREEVARTCLVVAEELTGSKFGFLGEVNGEGRFDTIAISNPGWVACKMPESDAAILLKDMELRGIWASVLRQEQALLVNDPASHPERVGTPEGHPQITSFLGIPLKRAGKTIGMIGLANKESGYDLSDQHAVETLSAAFMEALNRKGTEEVLRQSEERYRRITEAVSDYIFTVRIENGHPAETIHSPACVAVTRYTAEDFAADPYLWFRMVHEEDRAAVEEQAAQILSWQDVEPLEHRIFRKDNMMRWVKNSLVAHCDPQGKLLSYDGLISDIHERKCAEEAMRESEEKFKTLFNSASDAVFIHDFKGEMLEVNQVACERLGYSRDELFRMTPMDFNTPYQVPLVSERLKGLQEKGYLRFETAHVDRNGNIMPVEIISQTIDYEGKQAVISTARDISERKRAEEEKRKFEARLIQAHKMESIGTFAGGIAHDFNNILAAIMGYSELVQLDLSKEERASDNLGEVLKAANRAKELVRQLLTFSRQSEPEPKPLQMAPIVKEALKLLRASIPTTIEIRQEINSELGTVVADPTQIHQVLMNLCSNAAQAMQENGGVLNVKLVNVHLDVENLSQYPNLRAGPYVRLTVSDTGCGMEENIKERIFDPFFTTKGPGEGTGMGLAVVHGIVNSHGGAITVYSEPGKGTTFHVLLPRVESMMPMEDEKIEPLLTGSERILLVDDEQTLVNMGERMLKRLGYQVVPRTSSVEALEAFREQPGKFDLVITDQTMPDMTGEHLARELMNIRPDIPIILCTGYSQIISEKEAKAMGIAGFIMKPIVMRDLAKAVRAVLDRRE